MPGISRVASQPPDRIPPPPPPMTSKYPHPNHQLPYLAEGRGEGFIDGWVALIDVLKRPNPRRPEVCECTFGKLDNLPNVLMMLSGSPRLAAVFAPPIRKPVGCKMIRTPAEVRRNRILEDNPLQVKGMA